MIHRYRHGKGEKRLFLVLWLDKCLWCGVCAKKTIIYSESAYKGVSEHL
jgi:hypothetical protein